jgi:hypothetical protein
VKVRFALIKVILLEWECAVTVSADVGGDLADPADLLSHTGGSRRDIASSAAARRIGLLWSRLPDPAPHGLVPGRAVAHATLRRPNPAVTGHMHEIG